MGIEIKPDPHQDSFVQRDRPRWLSANMTALLHQGSVLAGDGRLTLLHQNRRLSGYRRLPTERLRAVGD
ncbi:MAG TPA: hypothetical protein VL988_06135 [Solirubrobacteraceae bacterium]|nr:hypothetical protein [Solirubrobacteraceae bacterium]HUA74320.1 hypothetical protein [Solirubrobacteraceae bacterium]